MSKYDEDKVKLRRAFSLEKINEEEESWIAEDNDDYSERDNTSEYER